jgi:hypothetical protein
MAEKLSNTVGVYSVMNASVMYERRRVVFPTVPSPTTPHFTILVIFPGSLFLVLSAEDITQPNFAVITSVEHNQLLVAVVLMGYLAQAAAKKIQKW